MTEGLWTVLVSVAAGFVLLWLALVVTLVVVRPADLKVADLLRLLPNTVVLLRRLAADPELPRGVRVRLGLLVYLILPIDLIPDSIPVIGTPTTRSSSRWRYVRSPAAPDPQHCNDIGPAPPRDCKPSDALPESTTPTRNGCVAGAEQSEQIDRQMGQVIGRLLTQFPQVSRDEVRAMVGAARQRFDGAPIRDFVPLFVERHTKDKLANLASAAAHPV